MYKPTITSPFAFLATLLLITGCDDQEPANLPQDVSPTVITAPAIATQPSEPRTHTSTQTEIKEASQTLKEMLVIAKAKDWTTFLQRYHGAYQRVKSPEKKKQLLDTFLLMWSQHLIPALTEAATLTPEIDGDRAVFRLDGVPIFELYRNAAGKWMCHI